MQEQKYYLGLDMGTSSVGWAVTDLNYHLLRAKGKDLWGVREFDEAATAADRRSHRVARRRRQRECVREGILKQLFHDEIEQVDPLFYTRLENSKYHEEDKDESVKDKNGIFHDPDYTDRDYYAQYPTIYHLRKELLSSTEPHDVRLVYLAILNMYKHRGHFLNAALGTEDNKEDLENLYEQFRLMVKEKFDVDYPKLDSCERIREILSNRNKSRKAKLEDLIKLLEVSGKNKKAKVLLSGICGLKMNLKELYGEEIQTEEKLELCFSDSQFEENFQKIGELLGEEDTDLLACMKAIYDAGVLAGIMKGYHYLSEARVAQYEKHKEDLKTLKKVMRKYCSSEDYNSFYRIKGDMKESKGGTYSAYVNSSNSGKVIRRGEKGRGREELYSTIKRHLKNYAAQDEEVGYILQEIENENFLPKQLTASNGVIPNQVHVREMKKILKNAELYLPFLKETDTDGMTVSEKIIKLFSFQVPYYVGPVTEKSAGNGGNGWVVRKEPGEVLPWNIEKKIDLQKTSEEFIKRLVRNCTYLYDEKVLPKGSLMYQRFAVLNEINSIRIGGEKPDVKTKQDIYCELFEKREKVKRKDIVNWLIGKGLLKVGEEDQLTGIDININNSLSTYHKFKKIWGEDIQRDDYREKAEQIVFLCTVYGDSKNLLKKYLQEKFGGYLDKKQIDKIAGFKFKDWGRLSKEFLQLSGCSKETGEVLPLIGMMWDSNDNLMELLSDQRYTYQEELEKKQESAYKSLNEIQPEDLDGMYFSAPVKRMVWQTLLIIKELTKLLGRAPERLFVEMARQEEKDKKRKDSRKKDFQELYKNIKDEEKNWFDLIESADNDGRLKSKKMYLYLTQKGRCMYTGHHIRLENLFDDNLYDIDHIYPRHFVKDDNLANNLVLVEKEKNAHKSDHYPIEPDIYKEMLPMWKMLHECKLINDEKFKRLTGRNEFTEEQKADFIARQLVETRQGTKSVAAILKEVLPETTIVYAKASNVSGFRHQKGLLKSRLINDFHHANDAYLNIVVGNAYYVKFTQNPLNYIKKEYTPNKAGGEYNLSRMFDWDIRRGNETAWIASGKGKSESGTIVTVKEVMKRNTPLLTRMNFEKHGGIAEQTLYSAKVAKSGAYIPLKGNDPKMQDVTKYGGFSSVATAYFFLVEHEQKGKKIRTLETVPVYLKDKVGESEEALLVYCRETLNLVNPSIRMKKIKIQSLIKKDGYYMHISGKTNNQIIVRNAVPLCLEQKWVNYSKKLEKESDFGEITKEKNLELYDILLKKHREQIFAKRPNPVGNKMEIRREKFESLDLKEQAAVLMQLLNLTIIGVAVADLREIGESGKTGVMLIAKKISDVNELYLVNQSVTGIWENRINLLTV